MALAVNNVVPIDNDSVAEPISYNAGSGSDRVLVVAVSMSFAGSNSITSVTYNGSALTRARTQNDPYTFTTSELWYHLSPATGSNTLTINTTDDTVVSAVICYVSGADTGSIGSNGGGSADSATASGTITPAVSGSLLLAAVVSNTDGSMSATGGSTELAETNAPFGGGQTTGLYSKTASGTGSQTVQATVPSDGWAVAVMEVKEATVSAVNSGFFMLIN